MIFLDISKQNYQKSWSALVWHLIYILCIFWDLKICLKKCTKYILGAKVTHYGSFKYILDPHRLVLFGLNVTTWWHAICPSRRRKCIICDYREKKITIHFQYMVIMWRSFLSHFIIESIFNLSSQLIKCKKLLSWQRCNGIKPIWNRVFNS